MYQTFTGGSGISTTTPLGSLVFSGNLWSADDFNIIVGDADETYIVQPDEQGNCQVTGVVCLNLNVLLSAVLDMPDFECERWLNENRDVVDVFVQSRYGCKRTGTGTYEEFVFETVLPAKTSLGAVAAALDHDGGLTRLVADIHDEDENLAAKVCSYVEGTS